MIAYTDIKKVLSYALIIFILFIFSGGSSLSNDKTVITGGWFFFTIVYFYYENYIKPSFIALTLVFIGVSILYYLLNDGYNSVTYTGLFIKIYLAYYCRDLCKDDFYEYFVKIIYVLTCISLILFTVQLINFDYLYNLNKIFGQELSGTETDLTAKSNSIIFTMVPIHVVRNCGFMWEPGSFVTVLIITLYINLFKQGESFFSTKNIVFLIAILTTQSTMGFLALLIPITLALKDIIMQNRTYQQLAVVIVPAFVLTFAIVFTRVDFLYAKMANEIKELEEEHKRIALGERDNFVVSVTRTMSVILDMQTIKKYPLLGLGVDMRTVSFKKLGYSEKLQTACGTTILILRFGLIGFILYTYLMYKNAFFDRTIHKIGWVLLINYALFTQEISADSFFHLFIF